MVHQTGLWRRITTKLLCDLGDPSLVYSCWPGWMVCPLSPWVGHNCLVGPPSLHKTSITRIPDFLRLYSFFQHLSRQLRLSVLLHVRHNFFQASKVNLGKFSSKFACFPGFPFTISTLCPKKVIPKQCIFSYPILHSGSLDLQCTGSWWYILMNSYNFPGPAHPQLDYKGI